MVGERVVEGLVGTVGTVDGRLCCVLCAMCCVRGHGGHGGCCVRVCWLPGQRVRPAPRDCTFTAALISAGI